MFRSILVPLDQSPFAERALPYAARAARASRAELTLALVHGYPMWSGLRDVPPEIGERMDAALREQESAYLTGVARRVTEETGLTVRQQLLEGPVVPQLRRLIETRRFDLIVMSSHGHGGIQRAWLGSTADGLVRHIAAPLLLIRPADEAVVVTDAVFTRVVIAVDGSAPGEAALETAAELCRQEAAEARVVRVVVPPLAPRSSFLPHTARLNQEELERRVAESDAYVHAKVQALRARGIPARGDTLVANRPAEAILDYTGREEGDLIAVGTRGFGGITRALVGSVADKVIRGATVPVLVHPPARGATAVEGAAAQETATA